MFAHIFWFMVFLGLIYLNRALYLRAIIMEAQAKICYDHLSNGERRSAIKEWFRRLTVWLIRIGYLLGVDVKDDIRIVSPRSILLWYKKRYKDWWTLKVNASGRRPGKPSLTDRQISLIQRLARENPLWPPVVIAGMFYRLTGRWIHRDTVRKYMLPRNSDPLKMLR